jgi:hypothetical protein
MIKSRNMRWMEYVVCMGEMRNGYNILVEKPVGKRPLSRTRHRWNDNIKMILGNRFGVCGYDSSGSG